MSSDAADWNHTGRLWNKLDGEILKYLPFDAYEYMRISDQIKQSVCFLSVRHQVKGAEPIYTPFATAFFLTTPYRYWPDRLHRYVVTARHNIDEAKKEGFQNLYLRINTTDGRFDHYPLSGDWAYPEGESTADVAVHFLDSLPAEKYEYSAIQFVYCVGDELMESMKALGEAVERISGRQENYCVGIGDDITVVGLFKFHKGKQRNIPIVRSGIIAAMPEEPIYHAMTQDHFSAYIIEVHSISGLSGSPVFVSLPHSRVVDHIDKSSAEVGARILFLLGVIRGHWSDEDILAELLPPTVRRPSKKPANKESQTFNTGVAFVTPFQEVVKILKGSKLTKERQREHGKALQEQPGILTHD